MEAMDQDKTEELIDELVMMCGTMMNAAKSVKKYLNKDPYDLNIAWSGLGESYVNLSCIFVKLTDIDTGICEICPACERCPYNPQNKMQSPDSPEART